MSYFSFPGIPNNTANLQNQVERAVCKVYKCSLEELKVYGKCRKRELVEPRQLIMALSHTFAKNSLRIAGSMFNKDHGTVFHSVKKVKDLFATNRDYREKAIEICHELNLPEDYFKRI
jgi:chromosomal replication initiation ATPase DnaA